MKRHWLIWSVIEKRRGSGPTKLISPLPRWTLSHRLPSSVALVSCSCPDHKKPSRAGGPGNTPFPALAGQPPNSTFNALLKFPCPSKASLGGFFPSNLLSSCSYFSSFDSCLINCSPFEGCFLSKKPGERAEGCNLGTRWVNPTVAQESVFLQQQSC